METQNSITFWSDKTFGNKHPAEVAARMSVEVAELVAGLATVATVPVEDMDPDLVTELQKECADVFIMLAQVAEKLQVELSDVVNFKMKVNRERAWTRSPSGKMQHVETFTEAGSGLEMNPALWYILHESGSALTDTGFESSEAALEWCGSDAGLRAGAGGAVVPTFNGTEWAEVDVDSINVFLGADLKRFWEAQE